MRCALVADIHANLQAWNAVLLDIRSRGVDRIVCLGDIVGYGPNPAEVLRSVHAHVDFLVLGNHDAVVAGVLDAELFNENARRVIVWTRSRLNRTAVRFLGSLPLVADSGFFRCAHGDFANPGAFNYILEPEDAMASWRATPQPLLFVGHTHEPGLFLLGESGTPRRVEPEDFLVEPGRRYLVRVGSVGHPREGDSRASYCIYDSGQNAVFWHKVPFDLDAYAMALKAAGLSDAGSPFLHHDPRRHRPPIRQMLNFTPATSVRQQATASTEVRRMELLEKRVWRWKALALCAALTMPLVVGVALSHAHTRRAKRVELDGVGNTRIEALSGSGPASLLPPATWRGDRLEGWSVRLADANRQRLMVGEAGAVRLQGDSVESEWRITSTPVAVKPGMKFCVSAQMLKQPGTEGGLALVVSLKKSGTNGVESMDQYVVKEPVNRKAGWPEARKTFTIPAGGCELTVGLRGAFRGMIDVRDVVLVSKP